MTDYYDEKMSSREDDFWSELSTELEFPWDDIPDETENSKEKKTIHVVLVEPGKLAREADIGTDLSDLQRAVLLGEPKPLSNKKIVKTRTKTITFWLTEEEREYIKEQAKRCGYSVQEYLRRLVYDKPIHEKPPPEFHEVLKNLRQINNNMNQIAAKANAMNFIDTTKYWANVSELQKAIGSLMEKAYG